ncbi:uncharacterized protein LOC110691037 [Chenopodium quinoa]|uniref:uncharacterized protein LOC110691037 n=1 Tax=Chenopodium quinoa TaxID=63459 RepID=UPI000B7911C8|nr:uncharacterized protein LOC110691037 [Chenopodium quinoa]
MVSVSRTYPIILYLRDVDMLLFRSQKLYRLFQKMLQKLSGPVRITHSDSNEDDIDDMIIDVPYNIEIKPPEDETRLVSNKSQLEVDLKMIQGQDNRNHIIQVLAANDIECDDLGSINVEDTFVLSRYIEEIVVSAISYHLMNNKHEYRNGKLLISFERSTFNIFVLPSNLPRIHQSQNHVPDLQREQSEHVDILSQKLKLKVQLRKTKLEKKHLC